MTRLTAEPLEPREVPTLFGAAGGVPLGESFAPDLSQTFRLNSLPGADWTVWLDFQGSELDTSRSVWQQFGTLAVPAFDQDGDPSKFSAAELTAIQAIARSVAEDYAPFRINVTTQRPESLTHVQRVVIGGNGDWYDPARRYSGATADRIWYAEAGPFGPREAVNFVWPDRLGNRADYVAEVISHEVGHAFGLDHDGTVRAAYQPATGGWAPIMGAAFGAGLSQWNAGTYAGATNREDDVAVIAATAGLRTDDYGDSFATAAALLGGQQVTGLISTRADVDAFRITSGAGPLTLTFAGAVTGNLYAQVSLYDTAGRLLAQGSGTAVTLTASVSAGTYFVTVDGVSGPAPDDYGSLGQFWLRIAAPAASPPPVPTPPPVVAPPPPPAPTAVAVLSVGAPVARAEGNSGSWLGSIHTFTIQLSTWLRYPVTVTYRTVDGTAGAGPDYTPVSGSVTFTPGSQSKPVSVYVWGDRGAEADETFSLEITGVSVGTVAGLGARGLANVLNDDGLYFAPGSLPEVGGRPRENSVLLPILAPGVAVLGNVFGLDRRSDPVPVGGIENICHRQPLRDHSRVAVLVDLAFRPDHHEAVARRDDAASCATVLVVLEPIAVVPIPPIAEHDGPDDFLPYFERFVLHENRPRSGFTATPSPIGTGSGCQ